MCVSLLLHVDSEKSNTTHKFHIIITETYMSEQLQLIFYQYLISPKYISSLCTVFLFSIKGKGRCHMSNVSNDLLGSVGWFGLRGI